MPDVNASPVEHQSAPLVSEREGTVLGRLTALLGEDVFLFPCEWGTKKPLVTYVERPFEGTKTEAYRALKKERRQRGGDDGQGAEDGGRGRCGICCE